MCFSRKIDENTDKITPRSPWRRLISQPLKPKLARSVIKSARVNLNRYWSKFEELSNKQVSLMSFTTSTDVLRSQRQPTLISVQENEINENLANELRESGN